MWIVYFAELADNYSTGRFKLEGKSRVVMPVISFSFSSASTRKTSCSKNTGGHILCKHVCTNCFSVRAHTLVVKKNTARVDLYMRLSLKNAPW